MTLRLLLGLQHSYLHRVLLALPPLSRKFRSRTTFGYVLQCEWFLWGICTRSNACFVYAQLFADPLLHHLYRYFQAGSVAAYEHVAMIKLHYSMADALDECIVKLSNGKVTLQERPHVTFKPLKESTANPPPLAVEDVPKIAPRISRDMGSVLKSYESLITEEEDYDDESSWRAI